MRDSPEKRTARARLSGGVVTMPSGYVYLGQFIDHDLTRDPRMLDEADADVEGALNYRTPRLDLDPLYGKHPAAVPCIYQEDGARLKLGLTLEAPGSDGNLVPESLNDLPRRADGTAVVIDPRSEESVLIAQLHVLFAKFHNRVLRLLSDQPALSAGPTGGTPFDQARRFVTWHYQWIVVKEFLPLVARQAVLEDIKKRGLRLYPRLYRPRDDPMAIPVEFAVAAFRFGHSLVQTRYFINELIRVRESREIITMTRRGGGVTTRLPASHVVNWDRFFARRGQANFAQTTDTFITETLYDLPPASRHTPRLHAPLPELTLLRGSLMGLPSGQEFVDYFHLPRAVAPEGMWACPEDEEFFRASGYTERTPLWYYLLREAAVEPNSEPGFGPNLPRQKLGSTGSRIVAEVLYQVLNADPGSISHAGAGWRPPAFSFGGSSRARSLSSMPDLVEFARSSS